MFSRAKLKEIIFLIISFVFSIVFWYFFKIFLGQIFLYKNAFLAISFFLEFACSFVIFLIITKENYFILINSFLGFFSIFIFFNFNIFYLIPLILAFFILFIGFLNVKKLKLSQMKINLWPLVKKGSFYFLNSAILVILFISYFSFISNQNIYKFQIPKTLFNYVFEFSLPVVRNYIPNLGFGLLDKGDLNSDKTIDELIFDFYSYSFSFKKTDFKQAIKNPEISFLLNKQKDLLGKQIGIEVKGNEKIPHLVYLFLNKKVRDFAQKNPFYFKLIVFLVLFSVIKLIVFPLKYLLMVLVFLVLKLLLLLKIINIDHIMVEKEELIL